LPGGSSLAPSSLSRRTKERMLNDPIHHALYSSLGQTTDMTTKREQYLALLAVGWSQKRIAEEYGVSTQAVSSAVTQPGIPCNLKHQIIIRDKGLCSMCGAHTYNVRMFNVDKPITIDNLGLLCGRCSHEVANHERALKHPITPSVCKLPGCDLPGEFDPLKRYQRRYCSKEHQLLAREIKKSAALSILDALTEKKCKTCKKTKPVSEFYRHKQKKIHNKYEYFYSDCKKCFNKISTKRYQKIREDKTSPEYKQLILNQRKWNKAHEERRALAAAAKAKDPAVMAMVEKLRGLI
jgi:hypothetical protein